MSDLFLMQNAPDADYVTFQVPVEEPFGVEGRLTHNDLSAFSPVIKEWIKTELREPVYIKTVIAQNDEEGLVFEFALSFKSLKDATMFKLKWM